MKKRIRFFCLTLLVMVAGMAAAQTYTVAGVSAIVKGDANWDENSTSNEMKLVTKVSHPQIIG